MAHGRGALAAGVTGPGRRTGYDGLALHVRKTELHRTVTLWPAVTATPSSVARSPDVNTASTV